MVLWASEEALYTETIELESREQHQIGSNEENVRGGQELETFRRPLADSAK